MIKQSIMLYPVKEKETYFKETDVVSFEEAKKQAELYSIRPGFRFMFKPMSSNQKGIEYELIEIKPAKDNAYFRFKYLSSSGIIHYCSFPLSSLLSTGVKWL